jgi:hypothetical protein
MYIRTFFSREIAKIYGHIWCAYTVLANPSCSIRQHKQGVERGGHEQRVGVGKQGKKTMRQARHRAQKYRLRFRCIDRNVA